MKRVLKIFRTWYDITYQIHKPAFNSRMLRDISVCENILGYKME